MSNNLTWKTGYAGDELQIFVEWHDENNVTHTNLVTMRIANCDKPRTLQVFVDRHLVTETIRDRGTRYIGERERLERFG